MLGGTVWARLQGGCVQPTSLTQIANAAADYVAAGDYLSPASGLEAYFFSTAAKAGGTEVALTPNIGLLECSEVLRTLLAFGGNLEGGNFNVASQRLTGTNDNDGDFELFNNSNSLGGASNANNHDAVVGEDLLFHPGQAATEEYVIARYTVSAADLVGTTGIASLTSSFQSFNDGGGRHRH